MFRLSLVSTDWFQHISTIVQLKSTNAFFFNKFLKINYFKLNKKELELELELNFVVLIA